MSGPVVLVCGGRKYDNARRVFDTLDAVGPSVVIQGGASGADALARQWAARRGVWCVEVPALWKAHGSGAGPRRNAFMLSVAEGVAGASAIVGRIPRELLRVVAFPGGRGTADMVRRARAAGVEVMEVADPAAGD